MLLTNEIIKELKQIKDRDLLERALAFIQSLNKAKPTAPKSNIAELMKFRGSISKEEGEELLRIIDEEFGQIDGEW